MCSQVGNTAYQRGRDIRIPWFTLSGSQAHGPRDWILEMSLEGPKSPVCVYVYQAILEMILPPGSPPQ